MCAQEDQAASTSPCADQGDNEESEFEGLVAGNLHSRSVDPFSLRSGSILAQVSEPQEADRVQVQLSRQEPDYEQSDKTLQAAGREHDQQHPTHEEQRHQSGMQAA